MVIPTVIQMGASSTADITNNCPEWGIYVEGFTYLANSLYTSFGNRVV